MESGNVDVGNCKIRFDLDRISLKYSIFSST